MLSLKGKLYLYIDKAYNSFSPNFDKHSSILKYTFKYTFIYIRKLEILYVNSKSWPHVIYYTRPDSNTGIQKLLIGKTHWMTFPRFIISMCKNNNSSVMSG